MANVTKMTKMIFQYIVQSTEGGITNVIKVKNLTFLYILNAHSLIKCHGVKQLLALNVSACLIGGTLSIFQL